jgi:hypothetical protein
MRSCHDLLGKPGAAAPNDDVGIRNRLLNAIGAGFADHVIHPF